MGTTKDTPGDSELRQRVEKHPEAADKHPETLREITPEKTASLIHEPEVHQTELKMQNDELRLTQDELEKTRDRYAHLYDFSPNGSLAINEKGIIHEANLTIAAMLGVDRSILIGQPFSRFIPKDDQDIFHLHRQQLLETEVSQSCDLRLERKEGPAFYARIKCMVFKDKKDGSREIRAAVSDITDRKQAEDEIQRAHREWEDIFQAIGHSTLILDGEHRVIHANVATEKATGKPEKDLVGKKCYEIFHNTHEPPKGCPFEEMIGSGHLETIEMEIEAFGDTFLVSCTPMLDDKDRIEKVIHIATDISVRIRAEEMLKASEERHRMMIEHMNSGVAVYETKDNGASFVFKEFNPAAEKISRIKREEVIGRGLLDLFPKMDKFGLVDALKRVWRTGKDERLHAGYYRDDQRQGWRDNRIYKLPSGEVVAIYDDVSEQKEMERQLKESEERFRTVADFNYDWEYWVSPDGRHIYVSPSCERITGYSSRDFLDDHRLLEKMIHPNDQSAFADHFSQTLQKKKTCSIDFRIITRSGEERWISHVCQPVYGIEGQYLGQRASNRDISEYKRIQEALQKSQKMEAIGTLTGGIAHDYNNLMSIIMGNLSMAMDEAEPGSLLADFLAQANTASLKVRDLTHELMSLSKGGAPVKEVGSLAQLLKDASGIIPAGKDISVKEFIPQNLWLVAYDPHKIGAVFRNMLTNAVEAMPDGGTLKIKAENLAVKDEAQVSGLPVKSGDYVRITIQDQGKGIPKEHLGKVFDPYFSTKAMGVQKGMGLGLATAYAIVQKHGGHIAIDSSSGAGTKVSIYLPAESEIVQSDGTIASADDKALPVKRVLVMDDEEMLRKLSQQMLERMGYAVVTVKDGVEAIEAYKRQKDSGEHFDAVILDLTIKGGMGGEQTIRELLKIDPGIKAIVSSGYFNDPVMAHFENHGFKGAMAKPYDKKNLKEALGKLFE